ncbi:Flp pilus assembly protein CpaB [Natronohydrobacter thiooxidans]|uniref:Flp pilus assembly protein CpaB n=1 Tax=Natronohydrobacter thiooxidans TaxID=87172 RepID=UPI0008FF791F|nr:Flp pilus assembly protein CpaB [Natronohydrobacter thiooxidans]
MLRGFILLVALSAGAIAAWMSMGATGALTAATAHEEAEPIPRMTEVLVASTDLATGTLVNPNALRWQAWPEAALNPAFITREHRPDAVQDIDGLVVRSGLLAGEPIHDARLSAADAGALSVMLAPGKRAVAVRVSAENSAGGFVLPNDRVDILLTTAQTNSGGRSNATSTVILKNVKVLAVDQMSDGVNEAVVGKTATLELTPAEVEILTAAEASGALSLALRSLSDSYENAEVVIAERRTVRIRRGGKMDVVELE